MVSCFTFLGPTDSLFTRLASNFNLLDKKQTRKFESSDDFIDEKATSVKNWAEQMCKSGVFPRGDYRELAELVVVILGGQARNGIC